MPARSIPRRRIRRSPACPPATKRCPARTGPTRTVNASTAGPTPPGGRQRSPRRPSRSVRPGAPPRLVPEQVIHQGDPAGRRNAHSGQLSDRSPPRHDHFIPPPKPPLSAPGPQSSPRAATTVPATSSTSPRRPRPDRHGRGSAPGLHRTGSRPVDRPRTDPVATPSAHHHRAPAPHAAPRRPRVRHPRTEGGCGSSVRAAECAGLRPVHLPDARRSSPRGDGDPRPQPDQHHHERLHPRRPRHPSTSPSATWTARTGGTPQPSPSMPPVKATHTEKPRTVVRSGASPLVTHRAPCRVRRPPLHKVPQGTPVPAQDHRVGQKHAHYGPPTCRNVRRRCRSGIAVTRTDAEPTVAVGQGQPSPIAGYR
jgi:hypothetical protein